jgi:hypothetical protein
MRCACRSHALTPKMHHNNIQTKSHAWHCFFQKRCSVQGGGTTLALTLQTHATESKTQRRCQGRLAYSRVHPEYEAVFNVQLRSPLHPCLRPPYSGCMPCGWAHAPAKLSQLAFQARCLFHCCTNSLASTDLWNGPHLALTSQQRRPCRHDLILRSDSFGRIRPLFGP